MASSMIILKFRILMQKQKWHRVPCPRRIYSVTDNTSRGGGCKLCANDNLKKPGLTNKDFISKAVALHGAIYDYSKVAYINT